MNNKINLHQALDNITNLAFDKDTHALKIANLKLYDESCKIIETALNENCFYKHIIYKICGYLGLDIEPFKDLVKTENEILNYINVLINIRDKADVAKSNKIKVFEITKENINPETTNFKVYINIERLKEILK